MSTGAGPASRRCWRPPRPTDVSSSFIKRCEAEKQQTFLDPRPLAGHPDRAWASFCQPLLRSYPRLPNILWRDQLGHGVDGIAWNVTICGDIPPPGRRYWAFQRECQNVALLQMVQSAIESSTEPIYLHPQPNTRMDAVRNLHAFSHEGFREQRFKNLPNAIPHTSVPRLRKCLGWMKVPGAELCALQHRLRPRRVRLDRTMREILPTEDYYALVYEFIPKNPIVDINAMQSQADFLWRLGFCFTPIRLDNWEDGLLLDMADIVCPWAVGWSETQYTRPLVKDWVCTDIGASIP
ncbi:uncharacterized protein VDAG_05222 [Verticillium dahliae VdLs.17]|uniref:Uncharacterized protein n=1 Tax=Verticillium dahliae (strain VdLs.17 / ATCC MYA-4575 / FGSC 10137) TaxID=498257 RepID=G2X4Z0_VERDV|nr:uncharacterized protein VDAG_05222 [Verticillium dahliae VdLs.17]EGY23784.1 hypothetical protein VDAG_05222 [Verticillium dahliae VdLs.17]